jgi:Ca-activated chloride channel family protein
MLITLFLSACSVQGPDESARAAPSAGSRGPDKQEGDAAAGGKLQIHRREPIATVVERETPKMPVQADQARRRHKAARRSEKAPLTAAPAEQPRPSADAALPQRPALAYQVPAAGALQSAPSQQISGASIRLARERLDRERYGDIVDNAVKRVADHPVSTFSIDVDTGAYANVRRFLNHGRLPPKNAVRAEEMINYFAYDYPAPEDRRLPFRVTTQIAPAPWHSGRHLLHIGIKGYEIPSQSLAPANLVLLVDVSGSMRSADKLDLLKQALKMFSAGLRPEDRLSIVVYAGASGVVLEPVSGDQTATIHAALDGLYAGGSTNGGAGIRLAYAKAREAFIRGGINRVILATDGDFNVGTVDFSKLKGLVERERASGISLTTLGFGTGNYNDRLMEQLADAGNGNHAYIDSLKEANKVLVQQMSGTLNTIAKDVKIQIEFNPQHVVEYRLIGYENRVLRREDFNNDKVDAGEIGAGHTVTALYEVALAGSEGALTEALRYAGAPRASGEKSEELAFLRMRFKAPGGEQSRLMEWPLLATEVQTGIAETAADFRFAAAVAGFAQILRGGTHTAAFGYPEVLALARDARGRDPFGYRGEFLSLVNLAQALDRPSR